MSRFPKDACALFLANNSSSARMLSLLFSFTQERHFFEYLAAVAYSSLSPFPHEGMFISFQRGWHIVLGGKSPVSGSNESQIHHIFESILCYGSQRRSRLSVRRCFFRCLFIDMSIVHGSCQSLTLSCILLYFYTHSSTHILTQIAPTNRHFIFLPLPPRSLHPSHRLFPDLLD